MVGAALVLALSILGFVLYWGHKGQPWWEGRNNRDFWKYLELLVIPAAIAIGATAINWMQSERARKAEDAQQDRAREAAEASRKRELDVAERRAQADALQAYLDQMGRLLLDKDRPLRESGKDSDVQTLARARTLTVLTRLDASRKGSVLQFMYESGLVNKGEVVVSLKGADLSAAVLSAANLHGAYLGGADLRRTYLHASNLLEADLSDADLSEANLRGADLKDADLRRVDLKDADLHRADLSRADLRQANPLGADSREAYLSAVNLRRTNLSGAFHE